jgi:hypothetical protein
LSQRIHSEGLAGTVHLTPCYLAGWLASDVDVPGIIYNSYRLHSYLGYVSPNQYEAEMAELKKAA